MVASLCIGTRLTAGSRYTTLADATQQGTHTGIAPYKPNSLDAGNPVEATESEGAFIDVPQPVKGK